MRWYTAKEIFLAIFYRPAKGESFSRFVFFYILLLLFERMYKQILVGAVAFALDETVCSRLV